MLNIFTPQEAFETILKRVPLDEMEVSGQVKKSLEQIFGKPITPDEAVRIILQEIRQKGDRGLQKWSGKIDGWDRETFRVSINDITQAFDELGPNERQALALSVDRVKKFYTNQPLHSWIKQTGDGTLGQFVRPIRRIGIYVPGGTAPLPSTVIMSVVPAQVAGVREIVLVVPPDRSTGEIAPITLATAGMLGIKEIYALGGAQAIGALAFGTESIPKVDKIFGPGNLFVTLAKRQVFGVVGIDGLAGPTETLVIADDSANPDWVAADLLAQAEHDALASAILLTWDRNLAKAVQASAEKQIPSLPRAEIVLQSLKNRSGIVITKNLQESIDIANAYAPEHLCLSIKDAFQSSENIIAAGGIFVGEYSCEVLGDYVAGPSHVMPTGGTARFASPLNLWDFVHLVSLIALNEPVSSSLSTTAGTLARLEGLEAHARSADARIKTRSEHQ